MNTFTPTILAHVASFLDQPDYCDFFKSFRNARKASKFPTARTLVTASSGDQALAFKYSKRVTLLIKAGKEKDEELKDLIYPTIVVPSNLHSLHLIRWKDGHECYLFSYCSIDHLILEQVTCESRAPAPNIDKLTLINARLMDMTGLSSNITSLITDSYDGGKGRLTFKKLIGASIDYHIEDWPDESKSDEDCISDVIKCPLRTLVLYSIHGGVDRSPPFHLFPTTLLNIKLGLKRGSSIHYKALDVRCSLFNLISFEISGDGQLRRDDQREFVWTDLTILRDSSKLENLTITLRSLIHYFSSNIALISQLTDREIGLANTVPINLQPHVSRLEKLRNLQLAAAMEYKEEESQALELVQESCKTNEKVMKRDRQVNVVIEGCEVINSALFKAVLKLTPS